jgi:2-methylcitrate dehydratase PrpD
MDAAYEISKFITHSKFEDLPKEAIQVVKKEVLDTLANVLGGSRDKGVKVLHDLIRDWGGREESTIIGYGTRVPCGQCFFRKQHHGFYT